MIVKGGRVRGMVRGLEGGLEGGRIQTKLGKKESENQRMNDGRYE